LNHILLTDASSGLLKAAVSAESVGFRATQRHIKKL